MSARTRQNIGRRAAGRWLLAASCLAALGCGSGSGQEASQQRGGRGGRGGPGGPGGPGESRVVPVEVAQAELGTAARTIAATGTVEPIRTVGVNSQLSGALLRVNVEEGDVVRAGAVLARLDSREVEAQLASAQAALTVAKSTADRSEQLREQQIVTVAEYQRDQAAYAAARATYDQLRTRVGYATIRAPLSGVVLEKRLEAGDIVAPQTRLFTIGDVSTLVVRVPVSELDVAALDEGDRVSVGLDALPDRVMEGRIRRVFPAADTLTRLVPVEVALVGANGAEVRPGFLARVSFQLAPRAGVLMVPAGSLVQDGSGSAVFVVRGGQASRQRVKRGGTFQGRVEIVEGLSPGDTVVVAGATELRDGASVRIVEPPAIDPGSTPLGATGTAATESAR